MFKGLVTINLDPPYVSITSVDSREFKALSLEQLKTFLTDLGLKQWPLDDCVIRLDGQVSEESLQRIGMLSQKHLEN